MYNWPKKMLVGINETSVLAPGIAFNFTDAISV